MTRSPTSLRPSPHPRPRPPAPPPWPFPWPRPLPPPTPPGLRALVLAVVLLLPSIAAAQDSFGVAREVISFDLPAGPGGLTPSLELHYSSAAGNGNAGVGWSLPYSSIRMDLRQGAPHWRAPGTFDCGPEWNRLLWLDGMELSPSTADPTWDPQGLGFCVFRTRPDTFVAVVPYFGETYVHGEPLTDRDSQPLGFVVIRPDGTLWWYGDDPEPSPASEGRRRWSTARYGDPTEVVTEWFLHAVEDRDGNTVVYHPEWDTYFPVQSDKLVGSAEVRLRMVSWARALGGTDTYAFGGPGAAPAPAGASWVGAIASGSLLADPAPYFPDYADNHALHHYAAVLSWEVRPDARLSLRSGERQASASRLGRVSVARNVGGVVDLPFGSPSLGNYQAEYLRSWVLQYDEGSTGRSRLRRVWPIAELDPDDPLPPAYPDTGRQDWDTASPDILENPWEIAWSDDATLDPAGPAFLPAGDPSHQPMDPISSGERFWFEESWPEGGFALSTLRDLTGDGLPDQVEHGSAGMAWVPIQDNLLGLLPHHDNTESFSGDKHFLLRPNLGAAGWGPQVAGPEDPVALYATYDVQVAVPGCGQPGNNDLDNCTALLPILQPHGPSSTGPYQLDGMSDLCEHAGNLGPALDLALPSEAPFYPLGGGPPLTATHAALGWCEYRSCAPFCEQSTVVTLPVAAHTAAYVGGFDFALERVRSTEASSLHDPTVVDLWEKYAVTAAVIGSGQQPNLALTPFGSAPAAEPETRVRHVDGYARPSFQTRIHDSLGELARFESSGGEGTPEAGYLVESGLVHDLVDMNGDGHPDRVLGGAGILANRSPALLAPEQAVKNPDSQASKDQPYSTERMSWMVAFFDPTTGEFGPMTPWTLPYDHPELLGPYAWPTDASLWHEHQHLSWLSVWEATEMAAPVAAGGQGGVSVGPGGASAGVGMSLGPVSVSFGLSAGPSGGSFGPSLSLGPISVGPGGFSLGPMSYSFANGSWGSSAAGWAAFVIKIITDVMDKFDVPYAAGIHANPNGLSLDIPGFGSDCLLCEPHTRFQRQGLVDLNGDRRPDYVLAGRDLSTGEQDRWLVLFNDGDGFEAPVVWEGIETDYLSLVFTDVYRTNADTDLNASPFTRRSHELAGLRDMNGDGLPDFVFLDFRDPGDPDFPKAHAVGPEHKPDFGYFATSGWELFVMLNNGRGFEEAVPWWDEPPPELIGGSATLPALSATRMFLETWEPYNNNAAFEMQGLRDWNGDGLPDYFSMQPLPQGLTELLAPTPGQEDRTPKIWLNTGLGFATDPLTEESRYGAFELDTGPLSGEQTFPEGPPGILLPVETITHPYPSVSVDLPFATDPLERSAGAVEQSFIMDLDGDGALDWVIQGNRETATAFSLQSEVPDLVTGIRRPEGRATALDWAPARDFLDLPGLPAASGLSDGAPDAFPAFSQVQRRRTDHDGVTDLVLVDELLYADPVFDGKEDRSYGFRLMREIRGDRTTTRTYHADRERAGLRTSEAVSGPTGHVYRRETFDWSDQDFVAAPAGLDTFAWAERRRRREDFEPPPGERAQSRVGIGGGGSLVDATWTFYDPRSGEPACIQTDQLGDGSIDLADVFEFDPALAGDGFAAAVETEIRYLPAAGMMGPGECKGSGVQWNPVRKTDRLRAATGRVEEQLVYEPGNPVPIREDRWEQYPNGELLGETRGALTTDTHFLDPVIGVHRVRTEGAPAQFGLTPPFVTERSICGITASCGLAAHGSVATETGPGGLWSSYSYDAVGRLQSVQLSSPYGQGEVPPVPVGIFAHERYVRLGGETDWAVLGRPHTITEQTLIDAAGPTPGYRTAVGFLDGHGRPLERRIDWEVWDAPTGTVLAGQRVEGFVARDDRDRPAVTRLPCFSGTVRADRDAFVWSATAAGSDCLDPPAEELRTHDPLDRELDHTRPDGSLKRTRRYLAALPDRGLGLVQKSIDPAGAVVQAREDLEGPGERRTWLLDAETWTWSGGGGSVTPNLVPGPTALEVRRTYDASARMTSISRTGHAPGDETVVTWRADDLLDSIEDPDRGLWRFDYDEAGRLVRRELFDRSLSATLISETEWLRDDRGRVVEERSYTAGGLDERRTYEYDGGGCPLPAEAPWRAPFAVCEAGADRVTAAVHEEVGGAGPDVFETFLYDALGRLAERRLEVPTTAGGTAETLAVGFEYFPDGEVLRTWLPESFDAAGQPVLDLGASVLEVARSASGLPLALHESSAVPGLPATVLVSEARYDILGRPAWTAFGNGSTEELTYAVGAQENQALEHIELLDSGGQSLLSRDLSWDPSGNLRAWEDLAPAWSGTAGFPEQGTCHYDGASRLLGCELVVDPATNPEAIDVRLGYRYDPVGNLLEEDVVLPRRRRLGRQLFPGDRGLLAPGSGPAPMPANGVVARVQDLDGAADRSTNFAYDDRGRLVAETWLPHPGSGPWTASEDGLAPGGPPDATRLFEWSDRGRLLRVHAGTGTGVGQVVQYHYDRDGRRVGKVHDTGSGTVRVTSVPGLFELTESPSGDLHWTTQLRFGERLVAEKSVELGSGSFSETVRWRAGDHLGSASVLTDELGDLAVAFRYEPYGRIRDRWGPETGLGEYEPGRSERLFHGMKRESAAFGLAGQPYQLEAYDYGARWYSTTTGTWMSADPLMPDAVNEANAFAYVAGNPLTYRDPDGHFIETAWDIASFGMGVYDTVRHAMNGDWAEAGISAAGALVDGAAVIVPGVPGGVGVLRRSAQTADKLLEANKTVGFVERADDATDAARHAASRGDEAMQSVAKAEPSCPAGGCGGPGLCFVAGTPVVTPDGLASIESISADDRVLSRDPATGEQEWKPVVRTFVRHAERTVVLDLDDGHRIERIEATEEHPFRTRTGWTEAGRLRAGDEVFTSAGGWLRVAGATWVEAGTAVYNFEVQGFHTYFVGEVGAWVHNAECGGEGPLGPLPALHPGKQGKHIPSHPNFLEGRSVLTADPAELARRVGTGTPVGKVARGEPGFKERIDFGEVIGDYVQDGVATPTTKAIVHYSRDGIHIVPAAP